MPLEVKDLSVFLASGEVVTEHVSFQIENGKMLSIVGSSGAGKTTICKKPLWDYLAQHIKPREKFVFQGKNLLSLSKKECQKNIWKRNLFFYHAKNPMTAFNPSLRVGETIRKLLQHHARTSKDEKMFFLYSID